MLRLQGFPREGSEGRNSLSPKVRIEPKVHLANVISICSCSPVSLYGEDTSCEDEEGKGQWKVVNSKCPIQNSKRGTISAPQMTSSSNETAWIPPRARRVIRYTIKKPKKYKNPMEFAAYQSMDLKVARDKKLRKKTQEHMEKSKIPKFLDSYMPKGCSHVGTSISIKKLSLANK